MALLPKTPKIYYLGPAKEVEELLNGKVDAIVMGMGAEPHLKEWLVAGPMRTLEASGRKLYYIGMDKSALDKTETRSSTRPTWPLPCLPRRSRIKTNPLSPAQTAATRPVKPPSRTSWPTNWSRPWPNMAPRWVKLHGLWKIWSPELMVGGLTEKNTHPGAIKAYKELGFLGQKDLFAPL